MKARKVLYLILIVLSLGLFVACENTPTLDLSAKTVSLEVGATQSLTAIGADAITWSSSDESVVSVKDGVLTAVKAGTATITATAGSLSATCTVTVTAPAVTVTISSTAETLAVNGTVTLTASASDSTAIEWSTSDETIATVADGLVTGIAAGTATITAKAGTASATCLITVSAAAGPQIVFTNTVKELYAGEKLTLTFTNSMEEDIVAFKSSNRDIATVNGTTGIVTGKEEGTVTITATSAYTGETAEIDLTVKRHAVESITIAEPTGTLSLNSEIVLVATVLPANALQGITWATSDSSIIDIDESGLLSVKKSGTVTITATSTADTTKKGSIELTSAIKPEELLAKIVDKSPMIYDKLMYWQSDDKNSNPTYDINGSVLYYYLEDLTIDSTSAAYRFDLRKGSYTISTDDAGDPYIRTAAEINLVVVHDAGSAGTAKNTALWGNGSNSSSAVSYGYTVGNDGVYQIFDDCYIGWHAGDGTSSNRQFRLYDTGIPYKADYTLGISASTGKWTFDGVESKVFAGTKSYTTEVLMATPSLWNASDALTISKLTPSGMVIEKGVNGNYWINNSYFNSGYGLLCNAGGGFNGIGIESMVNTGDDIYITWHRLAKLVAYLCVKNNLPIEQVVYHNSCSGKTCPHTMISAGEVSRFEELVAAEYLVATELSDYTWSVTTNHPEYVNSKGHITSRPAVDTNVVIDIKLTSKTTGQTVSYSTNTIISAKENK